MSTRNHEGLPYLRRPPHEYAASLFHKIGDDTTPAHTDTLPLIQRIVEGINKSGIVDFQLTVSSVDHAVQDYSNVTFTPTKPVEQLFFNGGGPLWSTIRSVDTMQKCWKYDPTEEDITLVFNLAYHGVNVDNEVITQYEKRVSLDDVRQRLQSLVPQESSS